jgi:uncharacterized protein YbjT (DUF2867 family)
MKVAIAGASGFIGSRLATQLAERGHEITALTRNPESYQGAGSAVCADVNDAKSLLRALQDQETAYYLVHSLTSPDFAKRDRIGARTFAQAAVKSGVTQVIYLGGLGDESQDLSEHLRSRREVEKILMDSVPTTALRAGIVIGEGSISWEILRQLVVRLPVMITPRWVETRTQPIALSDALFNLLGSLGRQDMVGQFYEIGGPEPLTYRRMMMTVGRLMGYRRVILPVPLLSPRLSSHWLRFITDVDLMTARALVDSMCNEVVVHDHRINDLMGHEPMGFEAAAFAALQSAEHRTDTSGRTRANP